MTEERPVFVSGSDQKFHNIIIGQSGKGRSAITQQLADQEGVSYEEMERRCQPTKEQIEHREQEQQEARMADEKRLQLVREAYWSGSRESDFSDLHNSIVEVTGVAPTIEQIRSVFNFLPAEIISGAIQWGLDDTEVRDNAYVFIQENESKVRAAMGL